MLLKYRTGSILFRFRHRLFNHWFCVHVVYHFQQLNTYTQQIVMWTESESEQLVSATRKSQEQGKQQQSTEAKCRTASVWSRCNDQSGKYWSQNGRRLNLFIAPNIATENVKPPKPATTQKIYKEKHLKLAEYRNNNETNGMISANMQVSLILPFLSMIFAIIRFLFSNDLLSPLQKYSWQLFISENFYFVYLFNQNAIQINGSANVIK